jgi:hypothetical protein
MQKRHFYLVAGSKGGVGKSLATMAFLGYLRTRGINVFLFESDTSNPDVAKSYASTVPHQLVELDRRDGWIEMVNRVGELTDSTCVVNTGSRSNTAVAKFSSLLESGLGELGVELVTIWMINTQRDSVELLHEYHEALPAARIHVMRNEHSGASFSLYDKSDIRTAVEASGGKSHVFPDLASRVTDQLYNGRQTLEALETAASSPLGNRMEVRRWRNQVSKVFDAVVSL